MRGLCQCLAGDWWRSDQLRLHCSTFFNQIMALLQACHACCCNDP